MYYVQIEVKTDFGYAFKAVLSVKGKSEWLTSDSAQRHADIFNNDCENNDRAIVLRNW
jgi:hypothetical protein